MVGAAQYGELLRPGPAILRRRREARLRTHDFVFIHIPKTGGISVRTALGMDSMPYHLTAKEWRVAFPDSIGKFSFSFVRNPFERIVSYGHSMRIGVDWHDMGRFDRLDLQPQSDFIFDENGEQLVDFVGRFEDLARDFGTVCGHLGIETPPLPHLNRSEHRHYREYYDDESRQFMEYYYKDDIERFGYTF